MNPQIIGFHLFESISCAHSVAKSSNNNRLLGICHKNHEHFLQLVRKQIPIGIVELLIERVELRFHALTKRTYDQN